MTKRELLAEHSKCQQQYNGWRRLAYKVLHLGRKGCPACTKKKKSAT